MGVAAIVVIFFSVFIGVSTHQKGVATERALKQEVMVLKKGMLSKRATFHRKAPTKVVRVDDIEIKNLGG